MKTNKNCLLAVLLLIGANYVQGMDNQAFPFTSLPTDLQHEITIIALNNEINRLPDKEESLQIAAQKINNLVTVNKNFEAAVNQPAFCLKLIKSLAAKFNCSDEDAAKALNLRAAKDRMAIQNKLQSAIGDGYSNARLEDVLSLIQKSNADLNFTMNNPRNDDLKFYTPLIKTLRSGRITLEKIAIIRELLKNGANPSIRCAGFDKNNPNGLTAFEYEEKYYANKHQGIKKILKDSMQ